jgi:hypothetical protein
MNEAREADQELIDIACKVVRESEKAVAVVDGTTEMITDKHGKMRTREKFFWLPKSLIEVNDDGTVTMPVWLATERGLV